MKKIEKINNIQNIKYGTNPFFSKYQKTNKKEKSFKEIMKEMQENSNRR